MKKIKPSLGKLQLSKATIADLTDSQSAYVLGGEQVSRGGVSDCSGPVDPPPDPPLQSTPKCIVIISGQAGCKSHHC